MYNVGIDLGGTKIEGVVLDASGNECVRHRIATEQEKGYDHILARIEALYRYLLGGAGVKGEHTLGIGTPGAIIPQTGLLKNSNTGCLNGRPLRRDLKDILKHELVMQNDANCFALAEAVLGAGKGKRVVFGVIMGTGCGGGIVIDGNVLVGPQVIGGEWGHTTIDPEGLECWCGKRGCVETLISGGGAERLFERQVGRRKSMTQIVTDASRGAPTEREFLLKFYDNFGRALSNVINILDPDAVVLGGGLSKIDELYSQGRESVARYIFSDTLLTPIFRNELGDSAGVFGAALVAGGGQTRV